IIVDVVRAVADMVGLSNPLEHKVNKPRSELKPAGPDDDASNVDKAIIDAGVVGGILAAIAERSPLVLDVDASGTVELASLASADAVYFDLDNNGYAEAAGWTTGGDGFLALDVNEDGII